MRYNLQSFAFESTLLLLIAIMAIFVCHIAIIEFILVMVLYFGFKMLIRGQKHYKDPFQCFFYSLLLFTLSFILYSFIPLYGVVMIILIPIICSSLSDVGEIELEW